MTMDRIAKPREFIPLFLTLPLNLLGGLLQTNILMLIVGFVAGSFLVRSYYSISISNEIREIPEPQDPKLGAIASNIDQEERKKSGGAHFMAYCCPVLALATNCVLVFLDIPPKHLVELLQSAGALIGSASGAGLSFLMVWNERQT